MKLGVKDISYLVVTETGDGSGTLCSQFRKLIGLGPAKAPIKRLFDKSTPKVEDKISGEISSIVDDVYHSIKEYNLAEDLVFLRKLFYICEQNELTLEKSKMHRNLGMYYFQSNRISESIEEFDKAIVLVGDGECDALLISYYSDLGLVYFYNNDFTKAKHCYKTAESLLPYTKISDNILFLHNYRIGILYSNLQEYETARHYMEQSLAYAANGKDKGFATMNLGIIYKKQRNFGMAIQHYRNSLSIFDEDDNLSRSVVYNNLAELHKMYGQYDKALAYIDLAFKNISEDNMAKRFMYFNTYTEIKILMGEPEQVFDEFMELLSQVEVYHPQKSVVISGINDMALMASEDGSMLDKLEATVAVMISKTGEDDEEFRRELMACMNNISMYKYELKKQKKLFV